jgi:hypothetical protein
MEVNVYFTVPNAKRIPFPVLVLYIQLKILDKNLLLLLFGVG